jgi:hypothetical protein
MTSQLKVSRFSEVCFLDTFKTPLIILELEFIVSLLTCQLSIMLTQSEVKTPKFDPQVGE